MRRYKRILKEPSRELRKKPTPAEKALWERLRRKQIGGVPFYRQKPLADFVVDFFAPRAGLVVEADGNQHLEEGHAVRDRCRDQVLEQIGLRVLRFSNADVLERTDEVVDRIRQAVEDGDRARH